MGRVHDNTFAQLIINRSKWQSETSQQTYSHPSTHLFFHKSQLNSSFFNFLFTSLWALHNHLPKASLDSTFGAFCLINFSKSLAHQLQG